MRVTFYSGLAMMALIAVNPAKAIWIDSDTGVVMEAETLTLDAA